MVAFDYLPLDPDRALPALVRAVPAETRERACRARRERNEGGAPRLCLDAASAGALRLRGEPVRLGEASPDALAAARAFARAWEEVDGGACAALLRQLAGP